MSFGPGQATLYFRGVATSERRRPPRRSAARVGTVSRRQPVTTIGGALDIHVYDIARVEALAGPQGTLYGASSLAGTLRIITNKPDPTAFSAGYDLKADKSASGNGGGTVEGFVNIPLNDACGDPPGRLLRPRGRIHQQRARQDTYQRFSPTGTTRAGGTGRAALTASPARLSVTVNNCECRQATRTMWAAAAAARP